MAMELLEFSSAGMISIWVQLSVLALGLCLASYLLKCSLQSSRVTTTEHSQPGGKIATDSYYEVTPLSNLQWSSVKPLKIHPFKSRYHLTMGLETLTFSDLIAVDKTYMQRINLRRKIMADHADATLACNPSAHAAVHELHTWIFGMYLPTRFPTMFRRSNKPAVAVENLVTGETVAIDEPCSITALHNLGAHVDTDFLILLPSSVSSEGQPIYHLEAFVTCFPSGFSTRSKLSKPLSEIHKPVPGYATKLERSMDRYFARIAVGTLVKRSNWTITTSEDLFVQAGTHLYSGGGSDTKTHEAVQQERDAISIDRCRLRSERQTLHRLPGTNALVFAFKTYQSTLAEVKADGDGCALAEAIEGLATGSVPEMHHYKRGVIWGDKVASYLRA